MKNIEWEWVGFATFFSGFLGMEIYAIKTKKIKPVSHLVKWMQKTKTSRLLLMGLWTGFCAWTIRHFFFESQ